MPKTEGSSIGGKKSHKRKVSGGEELLNGFLHVHDSCTDYGATPRRYLAFLHTYSDVYTKKKSGIETRQQHLQAGIAKLNEAKELVDNLKGKAGEQSIVLAEKQTEADQSLREITETMQVKQLALSTHCIHLKKLVECLMSYLKFRYRIGSSLKMVNMAKC